MTGTYNIWLVGLSIVVAMIASYTALDLAVRLRAARGSAASLWLLGGAVSMGVGIWSMHFVGMLAFRLPVPLAYDIPITLGSMVPAVLASAMGLLIVRRDRPGRRALIASSCLIGLGIAGMHYSGMAALKMLPAIRYDPALFAASVLIAVAASWAALKLALVLRPAGAAAPAVWHRLAAAAVMGLAIAGMHYTGMAAAMFDPQSVCTAAPKGVDPTGLAVIVASGAILIFLFTIAVAALDATLQQRASALAEGMVRDLDASRARLAQSEASLLELAAVVEQSDDIVYVTDRSGRIEYVNPSFESVTGYEGAAVIGQTPRLFKSGTHDAAYYRDLWETLLKGRPFRDTMVNRKKSGELYYEQKTISPLRDQSGAITHFVSTGRDVTEHRLAELALRDSEELLRQLSGNIPQLFWVREAGGNDQFLYLSPAWHAITGRPPPADLQSMFDIIHPEDYRRVIMAAAKSPLGGIDHEYRIVRADGSTGWLHTRTFPVRNQAGEVYRVAGISEDISERKDAELRLLQMAHYDSLTNLPNRTLFRNTLVRTLENERKDQWTVAVLFIDVDRFKNVNDTLGHAVGDALLQQVALRLIECVRIRDVVGRLGGDEFAVMLPALKSADDAGILAGKMLRYLSQPLLLEGREVFVTASIGIAVFPADAQDANELLRFADTAMYRAKQEGRNTFRYYTAEMNARAEEKLELENSLRRALERREFLLHYQPKLDLCSGALSGVEALLRWQRPGMGLVSPADFIPLLEETGLIVQVGAWVIGEACRQIKAWELEGLPPMRIAINISSRQFQERDLAEQITQAAREHAIAPALLECEITESSLMSHAEQTIGILEQLSVAGIQVALDDFGTGYSSLSYLKRFPIQTLKIDRSFVSDVTTDRGDAAMALAIISMAHNMGLRVVAEGVETAEQLRFMQENGCDEIQGYLFSRPRDAAAIAGFCREHASGAWQAKAAGGSL